MNYDEKMMESLAHLIAFPSVSCRDNSPYIFGQGVYDALEYTLQLCDSLGFRTKNCNDLCGWAEAGSGEKLVGVLAHLDVVPPGEGWDTDPYEMKIIDGKVFGRGTMDDKGPAMTAIYAVKELLDEGALEDKRVRIIFGCSEETGDWPDIEYYKANEEIPSCGFTPDADFPLIYAEKGIANVEFTMDAAVSGLSSIKAGDAANIVPAKCEVSWMPLNGLEERTITICGKPAHGSTPEDGINAIYLAMREIREIKALEGEFCRFADFYMDCFADCFDGSLIDCCLEDELSGPITFNPGVVSMEDGKIRLVVDVRYPVTFTADDVMNKMEKAAEKWNVGCELTYNEDPMYVDKDDPLIETLISAYREVTGDMTEPMSMGGGTYAKAMDHVLAFGPVFPGRECTEHQCNEYILLDDLLKAKEIYKLALKRL